MDPERVGRIVGEALEGTDDGELFLEYRQSEAIAFDDGRVRNASFDTSQGFGLRAVAGEATGYAHSTEVSEAAIRRAGERSEEHTSELQSLMRTSYACYC